MSYPSLTLELFIKVSQGKFLKKKYQQTDMILEELLCAGRGQGDMVSLPRRMESGWVQLFGRWIDEDVHITVVSF